MTTANLDDHLGFWLRKVSNHVSHAFARKLAARDVTVAEWVVMRALYDSPSVSPSRLAGRLGLTRGAITKLADRLLEKSLITRKADDSDGRGQTLALTGSANALVPKLAALADANDAEFFGGLTAAERMSLGRILRKLVEINRVAATPTQ